MIALRLRYTVRRRYVNFKSRSWCVALERGFVLISVSRAPLRLAIDEHCAARRLAENIRRGQVKFILGSRCTAHARRAFSGFWSCFGSAAACILRSPCGLSSAGCGFRRGRIYLRMDPCRGLSYAGCGFRSMFSRVFYKLLLAAQSAFWRDRLLTTCDRWSVPHGSRSEVIT